MNVTLGVLCPTSALSSLDRLSWHCWGCHSACTPRSVSGGTECTDVQDPLLFGENKLFSFGLYIKTHRHFFRKGSHIPNDGILRRCNDSLCRWSPGRRRKASASSSAPSLRASVRANSSGPPGCPMMVRRLREGGWQTGKRFIESNINTWNDYCTTGDLKAVASFLIHFNKLQQHLFYNAQLITFQFHRKWLYLWSYLQ